MGFNIGKVIANAGVMENDYQNRVSRAQDQAAMTIKQGDILRRIRNEEFARQASAARVQNSKASQYVQKPEVQPLVSSSRYQNGGGGVPTPAPSPSPQSGMTPPRNFNSGALAPTGNTILDSQSAIPSGGSAGGPGQRLLNTPAPVAPVAPAPPRYGDAGYGQGGHTGEGGMYDFSKLLPSNGLLPPGTPADNDPTTAVATNTSNMPISVGQAMPPPTPGEAVNPLLTAEQQATYAPQNSGGMAPPGQYQQQQQQQPGMPPSPGSYTGNVTELRGQAGSGRQKIMEIESVMQRLEEEYQNMLPYASDPATAASLLEVRGQLEAMALHRNQTMLTDSLDEFLYTGDPTHAIQMMHAMGYPLDIDVRDDGRMAIMSPPGPKGKRRELHSGTPDEIATYLRVQTNGELRNKIIENQIKTDLEIAKAQAKANSEGPYKLGAAHIKAAGDRGRGVEAALVRAEAEYGKLTPYTDQATGQTYYTDHAERVFMLNNTNANMAPFIAPVNHLGGKNGQPPKYLGGMEGSGSTQLQQGSTAEKGAFTTQSGRPR